ncbi:MAG: hypothetical protein GY909_06625 [Oligoflexia bacterium]|nr:hypothetical protein [Oligoflexia bacterium]
MIKSKFLYPTKRNVLIGFILSQLLPLIVLSTVGKLGQWTNWIYFELIIIGNLILWRTKPDDEFDEREIGIVNKWKSRMLDYSSTFILLPIIVLSFKPEIPGWDLFSWSAVPVYIVFVLFSLLAKKELGYFFYEK